MWRSRTIVTGVVAATALLLTGCGASPAADAPSQATSAITVEHAFGTTTLPAKPTRVVALTNRDADTALALGVVPVGIHNVYRFPKGVGPWSEERLGTATPEVWSGAEFNYEAIAALRPDVILNINGDDDAGVHQRLAAIAPTVGLPKGQVQYGATPQTSVPLMARALGVPDAGRALLDDFAGYLDAQAAAHPEFATVSATYVDIYPDGMSAYNDTHVINAVLARLGFRMTSGSMRIPDGTSSTQVSPERLADYAADVMVIYPFGRTLPELEQQVPTLASLDAVRNGRAFVQTDLAFSAASIPSLRYGLERLLPEIARSLGS